MYKKLLTMATGKYEKKIPMALLTEVTFQPNDLS